MIGLAPSLCKHCSPVDCPEYLCTVVNSIPDCWHRLHCKCSQLYDWFGPSLCKHCSPVDCLEYLCTVYLTVDIASTESVFSNDWFGPSLCKHSRQKRRVKHVLPEQIILHVIIQCCGAASFVSGLVLRLQEGEKAALAPTRKVKNDAAPAPAHWLIWCKHDK
jgi:hypothetical protein